MKIAKYALIKNRLPSKSLRLTKKFAHSYVALWLNIPTVKVLRGSTNEALFIKQEFVTIVVTHLAADISEAECNAGRRHQEHTVIYV